jgi:hypothetical protein
LPTFHQVVVSFKQTTLDVQFTHDSHGNNTINFDAFNSTLLENKYLNQNITRCLFGFTNYAPQHLQFH